MRSRGGCATVEHLRALALVRQDGLSHSSESRTAGLSRLNESCATDPPRLRGRTSPSEVAPRPPRTHSIPRGRALPSESGSRSQGSHSVLRARIAFFEFEPRFSDSDSAPRARAPLLRFAFHSLGLLSLSGFKSRLPACIPPSEPEFRSSSSHSALRAEMPLLRLALALQVGMSHLWFTLRSPNPSFAQSARRLKPHYRISPYLHHRISPYLHRMFHVKHSFAHRKPCLAPPLASFALAIPPPSALLAEKCFM